MREKKIKFSFLEIEKMIWDLKFDRTHKQTQKKKV